MSSSTRLQILENRKQRIESQIADLEKLSDQCNQDVIAESNTAKKTQLNKQIDNYSDQIDKLCGKVDEINQQINQLKLDSQSLISNNSVEHIALHENDDQPAQPIDNSKDYNEQKFKPKLLELKKLLGKCQWRQADDKTTEIMLEFAGKQREEDWELQDIHNFSSDLLGAIDRLWQEHSNRQFGFHKQVSKYQENPKKFAKRVKWYDNNKWLSWEDPSFQYNAEMKIEGLLPTPPPFKKDRIHSVKLMPQLANKIEQCQCSDFHEISS